MWVEWCFCRLHPNRRHFLSRGHYNAHCFPGNHGKYGSYYSKVCPYSLQWRALLRPRTRPTHLGQSKNIGLWNRGSIGDIQDQMLQCPELYRFDDIHRSTSLLYKVQSSGSRRSFGIFLRILLAHLKLFWFWYFWVLSVIEGIGINWWAPTLIL